MLFLLISPPQNPHASPILTTSLFRSVSLLQNRLTFSLLSSNAFLSPPLSRSHSVTREIAIHRLLYQHVMPLMPGSNEPFRSHNFPRSLRRSSTKLPLGASFGSGRYQQPDSSSLSPPVFSATLTRTDVTVALAYVSFECYHKFLHHHHQHHNQHHWSSHHRQTSSTSRKLTNKVTNKPVRLPANSRNPPVTTERANQEKRFDRVIRRRLIPRVCVRCPRVLTIPRHLRRYLELHSGPPLLVPNCLYFAEFPA